MNKKRIAAMALAAAVGAEEVRRRLRQAATGQLRQSRGQELRLPGSL